MKKIILLLCLASLNTFAESSPNPTTIQHPNCKILFWATIPYRDETSRILLQVGDRILKEKGYTTVRPSSHTGLCAVARNRLEAHTNWNWLDDDNLRLTAQVKRVDYDLFCNKKETILGQAEVEEFVRTEEDPSEDQIALFQIAYNQLPNCRVKK